MNARAILTATAAVVAISALVHVSGLSLAAAQATTRAETATGRTSWGDPDVQGEWTSEGEYGVPFERAAPYGTRRLLTDAEYAKRLDEVRIRDERDLARVDVLSGKVDAPNAPIPHWREYNTTSRRTSLVSVTREQVHRLGRGLRAQVDGGDARALRRESEADLASDARPRSRHDEHPIREPHRSPPRKVTPCEVRSLRKWSR
jgi:hypothetical protein